jgi:hypothetical protein
MHIQLTEDGAYLSPKPSSLRAPHPAARHQSGKNSQVSIDLFGPLRQKISWVHDVNITLAKAPGTQRIIQVIQADKPSPFFFAPFASWREHNKRADIKRAMW